MSEEIERKFWVQQLPEAFLQLPHSNIRQGYLSLDPDGKEVRLRQKDHSYWLTVKGSGELERKEYEVELSYAQFVTLWPAVEEKIIHKVRYALRLQEKLVEIDVYERPLKGLIVAEIEFDSTEAARSFRPANWMTKEITHLNFMKNKNLLQFDDFEEIKQLVNS